MTSIELLVIDGDYYLKDSVGLSTILGKEMKANCSKPIVVEVVGGHTFCSLKIKYAEATGGRVCVHMYTQSFDNDTSLLDYSYHVYSYSFLKLAKIRNSLNKHLFKPFATRTQTFSFSHRTVNTNIVC